MTFGFVSDSLSFLQGNFFFPVSLIDSEEGSLQFNGGLLELLPYEPRESRRFDLDWLYALRGDAGFLKWRAGYGPVFDSFLLLSKMTRYLFTAVPALSCKWYLTCRVMWSRSIYIYIFFARSLK